MFCSVCTWTTTSWSCYFYTVITCKLFLQGNSFVTVIYVKRQLKNLLHKSRILIEYPLNRLQYDMIWIQSTPLKVLISSPYYISCVLNSVTSCLGFLPRFCLSVHLHVCRPVSLCKLWQTLPKSFNGADFFWGADLAQKHFPQKNHFVSFNICQGVSMSWKPGRGMHRHTLGLGSRH